MARAYAFCACCGVRSQGPNRVGNVRVVPRHPSAPDVGTIPLCDTCRNPCRPFRAWRWRWDPVDPDLAVDTFGL